MKEAKQVLVLCAFGDQSNLIADALASTGALIRQTTNPYRFLAEFISTPADIAFVDVEGLRTEDLEMIRIIRETRPDVGMVALVTSDQREYAANVLCSGVDLYLIKPAQAPELLESIDRAGMRQKLTDVKRASADHPDNLFRFALGVAHEINNPLTTISGWLQMLAADRTQDEELCNVLRSMKEESDRVADVIRRLLTFAQQEPPHKQEVDIGYLLRDLVRLHTPQCKSKEIELSTQIADELPRIIGDQDQLRQVFDAILTHVESSLSGASSINLSGEAKADGVQIVFQRDGEPLSKERLGRIFEPFQSTARPRNNENGLSMAYGIIRSHGGKIEVSCDDTVGVRFTVWLPAQC